MRPRSHAETEAHETAARRRVRRIGLVAGPVLAALAFALLPDAYAEPGGTTVPFPAAGRATAGLALWMGAWWLTQAIPIQATALLPLALLPLASAGSMREASAPYAHELIFLFMGGFLIALAMERWGLHRRLALAALSRVGDRPAAMIGGFMAVTALLSMWVSNTATAVMMLPVAVSVIDLVGPRRGFATCLLLGIAYGASIGGLATPIGTPPNLFLLSYLREHHGLEVSFVRWMGVGLPLTLCFLPIAWLLLTRVLFRVGSDPIEGAAELVASRRAALGPLSHPERVTLVVFLAACALWVTRPLLATLEVSSLRPFAGLSDAGIAMLAALVLFVARADREHAVLDWETAVRLPWGILVLFGGGLSLAAAIQRNGVGELLGAGAAFLAGAPGWLVVVCVVGAIVFLTELTSNTATAATLVPILAALAPGLGLDPLLLAVPAALAASCAFMLPVATPPNAVVFGSGRLALTDMSRAGLWLNGVGTALIPLVVYAVGLPLLR